MPHLLIDGLIVCCLLLYFIQRFRRNQHRLPPPPGPPGLPLIGNFFDMMATRKTETLDELRDRYGPIVYLKVFGTCYIYVNDYKILSEMFEKRGNIYSSRPRYTMNDLEGWNEWFISLLPYGPELRAARQKLHQFLHQSVISEYHPLQSLSAYRLATRLTKNPDDFVNSVRLAAAELIMKITYDYDVKEQNDPFIEIAEKGLEAFSDAQGYYVVNDVPWLQYLPSWLPWMGFLETAKRAYIESMRMYREPIEMFKKDYEKGGGHSSITGRLYEIIKSKSGKVSRTDEDFIAKVTSIIYAGGADTTVSAILTFILAMVLYPDVQKHAQEEIESVVGKDSLPTFDDLPKLVYVDAIRKECLRWQAVASTPAPHIVEVDDEIRGYRVPANSIIIGNLWAILRDPSEYPEPDKFIPERFLSSKDTKPPLEPNKVTFSTGRRICPGKHFAESSIFIVIATILATCVIEKATDDEGSPIMPEISYTQQFIRHPAQFRCTIKARNDAVHSLLHQAIDAENATKN